MDQLFDLRPLGQNQNVFSWTSLRHLAPPLRADEICVFDKRLFTSH